MVTIVTIIKIMIAGITYMYNILFRVTFWTIYQLYFCVIRAHPC